MPKFLKKGPLGRMIEAEYRLSDPELAEVRMTADEYRIFSDRINRAELEAKTAKAEAENKKRKIKECQDTNWQLSKLKESAEAEAATAQEIAQRSEERASNLQEQLKETQTALENEKYLNANMIRIMRERANQARGIRPKTQHDGYIVLGSRQRTEWYTEEAWDAESYMNYYNVSEENRRYAKSKGHLHITRKKEKVWKSIIQTPYNATIPIEQVKERIEQEMENVLHDIGVESRLESEHNGDYHDFGVNDDGSKKNVMYRWMYNQNCRTGFWEMELFTTESLQIPENRLPPQRNKGEPKKKAAEADNMSVVDSDLSKSEYSDAGDED